MRIIDHLDEYDRGYDDMKAGTVRLRRRLTSSEYRRGAFHARVGRLRYDEHDYRW